MGRPIAWVLAALAVAASLLALTPALAGAATVRRTSHGITASMKVGTHHPKAMAKWPMTFTVSRHGKPVKASVSYEWLYAGHVVHREKGKTFKGHFREVFEWPANAVGEPLTLRVVIVSGKTKINLDYAIKVVK